MDWKEMGFWGAILLVLSIIPAIGGILGIAGLVLVSLAYHTASKELKDEEIWKYYMYYLLSIIGTVVVLIAIAATFYFAKGSVSAYNVTKVGTGLYSMFWKAIGASILAVAALIGIIIVGSYFYKKALEHLADATGENGFRTAGMLFFIGGILTIILIGIVLNFVGNILLAIAFHNLRKTEKA